MKKTMKKVTAAMMTAAMVASFSGAASVSVAAEDDITIGVSIWSSTDVLGSQCKKIIDKAADALGVNVMYVDQGHVSELLLLLNSYVQQDVTVLSFVTQQTLK